MGATVRLAVEPHDVDDPDFGDRWGKEVDLRANEAGVVVRRFSRQEGDLNGKGEPKLAIQLGFQNRPNVWIPIGNIEIEPPLAGVHVPTGHRTLKAVPHDPAQRVHCRVRSHESVTPIPVDLAAQRRAAARQAALDPMPDTASILGDTDNRYLVVTDPEPPHVVGLATPTGVEHRSIEENPPILRVGLEDHSFHGGGVCVGRVDAFGHDFSPLGGTATLGAQPTYVRYRQSMTAIYFTTDPDANALLARDPFALLVGLTLHQQVSTEKAFEGPHVLEQRLGGELDPTGIADMDPDALEAVFRQKPALHRFPANMAKRVQAVARHLVETRDGDTSRLWADASTGEELMGNLVDIPGFGEYKARVTIGVLAKHYAARPDGYEAYLPDWPSVVDIDEPEDLAELKVRKKAWKASS